MPLKNQQENLPILTSSCDFHRQPFQRSTFTYYSPWGTLQNDTSIEHICYEFALSWKDSTTENDTIIPTDNTVKSAEIQPFIAAIFCLKL